MLAVYCRQDRDRSRLRAATPPASSVRWFRRPDAFHRLAPEADCAVAVTPSLREARDRSAVLGFDRHAPLTPLVVITRPDPENLRLLRRLEVEEVIWLGEVEARLSEAVCRASEARVPEIWAKSFLASPRLPPSLARALALACRADPPFGSVTAWARTARLHRGTLWRHWRAAVDVKSTDGNPPRPSDFLRWLQLYGAVRRKGADRTWEQVAGELRTSVPTLRRRARTLLDRGLSDLGSAQAAEVRVAFEGAVLRALPCDGHATN